MEAGQPFLAHTDANGRGQTLEDHLERVSEFAAKFAGAFSSSEWRRLTGLWHDVGKYQPAFQRRPKGELIHMEHAGVGAVLAHKRLRERGLPLSLVIAGHHAGLANLVSSGQDQPKPLGERLRDNENSLEAVLHNLHPDIVDRIAPDLPTFLRDRPQYPVAADRLKRSLEFWIRFLYSVLIDADRLDTEAFLAPEISFLRANFALLHELCEKLDEYVDSKAKAASILSPKPAERQETAAATWSAVNDVRNQVLDACRTTASEPPGIFSLTVPTGGGKTLSGMSFALRHTLANGMRRVIVVIPYTSIIEQNATEYKKALGSGNVIKHHSSYDPRRDSENEPDVTLYHLAIENWDAPVIVTTSVQFFETMFSSRPSTCRKLHNVAHSVVILDEIQTLPPGLLQSILGAINELVSNYGCSVVLSTATPPALAAQARQVFILSTG